MAFGLSLNLMSPDTKSIYSQDVSIREDEDEDHYDDQSADQEQQLVSYQAPQSQRQDQRVTYSPSPPEELIREIGAQTAKLQKKMNAINGQLEQQGAVRAEAYQRLPSRIADIKQPIDDANAKAARQAELTEVARAIKSASADEE